MAEFTGERVIPGQVDGDLWNEHIARYAFASRLARLKRVLDAGCGSGYGAADLARCAATVVGVDNSAEAVAYARAHYPLPNLRFLEGSCSSLPLATGSFDLVVSFEVIEHLQDWATFLSEVRRVLAPGGQAIISTPNSQYYTDSRGESGPNPWHEYEFAFEEFRDELLKVFPHVSMFVQNHVEGFVFQPVKTFSTAEARVESGGGGPEDSHFFVAVCALSPQTGAPTFIYLPKAANILREREQHIVKLQKEMAIKDQMLLDMEKELKERSEWAERLNSELREAGATIERLHRELGEMSRGYEAKVGELEEENRKRAEWALETERRLEDKVQELAKCVDVLHETEKTLDERTTWAFGLQKQVRDVEYQLALVRGSRWMKLGNAFGIGPPLPKE
ncbi:MAG TPA: methyltransferase domain-containing protein [Bryobacteraceae bacterium]|nr:methyltransferase domain-containing protein [Bryobacteraceae bacterium]